MWALTLEILMCVCELTLCVLAFRRGQARRAVCYVVLASSAAAAFVLGDKPTAAVQAAWAMQDNTPARAATSSA